MHLRWLTVPVNFHSAGLWNNQPSQSHSIRYPFLHFGAQRIGPVGSGFEFHDKLRRNMPQRRVISQSFQLSTGTPGGIWRPAAPVAQEESGAGIKSAATA